MASSISFHTTLGRVNCTLRGNIMFLSQNIAFFVRQKMPHSAAFHLQQCDMCDQQRLRPACAYVQSDQSLCLLLEYSMTVQLLTEHHLKFLSLKGGYTGSYESSLDKIPHCWKSHVMAQIYCIPISFTEERVNHTTNMLI